jgi:hypothetical protein
MSELYLEKYWIVRCRYEDNLEVCRLTKGTENMITHTAQGDSEYLNDIARKLNDEIRNNTH